MANVVLRLVTKRFGKVVAVDAVDLSVADGELVVVVGPSGCGKTTTLRLIAGLEDVTAGQIVIQDREVQKLPPHRRNLAMVSQNASLYPHLTVYGNLAFGLKMRGLATKMREKIQDVAQMLGIDELLDRRPDQLSGGEQQRVALGCAILCKADVFLLDEPLSDLDKRLRREMCGELLELHRRLGTTMIYVTHDQEEAMLLADRMVVMQQGRLEQIGTPAEIYDQPRNRFVADFVGEPKINLLKGRLEYGENGVVLFQNQDLQLTLPRFLAERLGKSKPSDVVVGIRPAGVCLTDVVSPDLLALQGNAHVSNVRFLGPDQLLSIQCGKTAITSVVSRHIAVESGQNRNFFIAPESLHVFDRRTEEALGRY